MDSDFHQIHPERRSDPGKTAPIRLGENIWVGARVTILKGVQIGRDAVVASGAVVTKNVPVGAIVAGNPARVIGSVYA
jgi:acetyltransferase-like isoleucine patch superfamily enzyme